jgi:hypothetical protein
LSRIKDGEASSPFDGTFSDRIRVPSGNGNGGWVMLTIQDCIGLCRLTEDEILAIAEHEHLPDMLALELGDYLCQTTDGELRVKRMIVDDIEAARDRGDLAHAAKLRRVLQHFLEHHAGVVLSDEQKS